MVNSYSCPIGIAGRQSGTPAAASTIWAIRNLSSTKTLYITRIHLNTSFDGTAAATSQQFQFLRFRTATPTSGTALTIIKRRTSLPASAVTDAREAVGGLTVTSVTFDTPIWTLSQPRQNGATQSLDVTGDYLIDKTNCVAIDPNDGLCIQLGFTAVAGEYASGFVEWVEG